MYNPCVFFVVLYIRKRFCKTIAMNPNCASKKPPKYTKSINNKQHSSRKWWSWLHCCLRCKHTHRKQQHNFNKNENTFEFKYKNIWRKYFQKFYPFQNKIALAKLWILLCFFCCFTSGFYKIYLFMAFTPRIILLFSLHLYSIYFLILILNIFTFYTLCFNNHFSVVLSKYA